MSKSVLNIEHVRQRLADIESTKHLKLHAFKSIDSTNLWLLKHGQCADVCIAQKQTHGYGRQGRRWHSPDVGNLYFSLKTCFNEMPKHYSLLSLQVAICLAETLEELGMAGHCLKWPNDLYYDDKKLGGILLQSQRPKEVIIGIGLNINMPISEAPNIDQQWDNIKAIGFELGSTDNLLIKLLEKLSIALDGFSELIVMDFVDQWNSWDMLFNQPVQITQNNQRYQGKMTGVDTSGRMRLIDKSGDEQYFSSGDVSVRL